MMRFCLITLFLRNRLLFILAKLLSFLVADVFIMQIALNINVLDHNDINSDINDEIVCRLTMIMVLI